MTAHRGPFPRRWLVAGGAVVLAGVVGVALLVQNSGAACAAPPATSAKPGKATFYDLGGTIGNCSFEPPADGLYVALGPAQYTAGASCGAYLDVTGPKGKVRVKVFDSCPECAPGHLDLSRTAFKKIADEVQGIVPITYRLVPNPATPGPISVRVKEGSSQHWLGVRIDNHANLLASVQVAGPGRGFTAAQREPYNYWLISGGAGPGPFKIKITDVYGRSATVTGITLTPGRTQSTSKRLTASAATRAPASASPSAPAAARSRPASPAARPSPSASSTPIVLESAAAEPLAALPQASATTGAALDLTAAEPASSCD